MTVYTIPVQPSVPDQAFSVDLDGVGFNLRLRWNTTAAQWFLDLSAADGSPIWSGMGLVSNWPLGIRDRDERRPAGRLMPVDTRRAPAAIGLADLGDTVQLVYFDASEA